MSGERGVRNGDRAVPEDHPDDGVPRVARPARGHPSPPRFSRLLLHRVLPRDVRDGAVAELDDKFRTHIASGMAPRRARRWYHRQVAGALHPRFWCNPLEPRTAVGPYTKGNSAVALNTLHDVRFGLRMLARNPALTAVIVLILAIGLGFNGAIFSLANTIILNDPPLEQPQRLLFVDSDNLSQDRESLRVSWLDYRTFAEAADSFSSVAAWYRLNINLSSAGGAPERFLGAAVEPSIFEVLRVRPLLGRGFETADAAPGAEPVALIGHDVWRTRFGGDEGVIGRMVQVNAQPAMVVGVLPAELERTPFTPAIWTPLVPTESMRNERDRRILEVVGRLSPGASQAEATAELRSIAARLAAENPATNEGVGVVVETFRETYTETANKTVTLVMMGAAAFLLLIACANVANLLVSRAIRRSREVVIRAALGASRWRVVRQLLVESLLLSALAALVASALAVWGARLLEQGISAAAPPVYWDFSVRPSVFVFIVTLSALTSIAFGLVPAMHATRGDLGAALKEGGRSSGGGRSRRLTGLLVIAQVAMSVVLLAGAGVMVRSTVNILDIDWVVDPEGALTMRLTLPAAAYPERDSIVAFHDELDRRLSDLPGVEHAVLASSFPSDVGFIVSAELEGYPLSDGNPAATLMQLIVSPDYFDLAGIQPLRGRLFDERDRFDLDPVVVVEQRVAERYWPEQDPIGKRLRWVGETEARWVEVIGVIPDVTQILELGFMPNYPLVYTPFRQEPLRSMGLLVRARVEPDVLVGRLRAEMQGLDDDLPLHSVAPLHRVIGERTVGLRIVSVLLTLLGGIALFLASVGIYAVMAFAVGSRRQEIGTRMALGARTADIVRMVSRTSLLQVAAGVIVGLAGASALTRLIGIFMYEVSPTDPFTFTLVLAVLLLTAALAGLIPARRASRVDPVNALRHD